MIGAFGHDSTLYGCTGPGTKWADEMNFVTNYAPGAGRSRNTKDIHR